LCQYYCVSLPEVELEESIDMAILCAATGYSGEETSSGYGPVVLCSYFSEGRSFMKPKLKKPSDDVMSAQNMPGFVRKG
jgi:hypothetical protein